MTIQPLLIGNAAEVSLGKANLVPRAFTIGSYSVSGAFWVLAGHANLMNGPDVISSWADSTHVKWRYFSLPRGVNSTLAVSGRCYIASANQVTRVSEAANAASTPYVVNLPWVGASQVCVYGATGPSNSGAVYPTPTSARWFDSSQTPGATISFSDSSLQPVTTDIVYDSVSPVQLGMADNNDPHNVGTLQTTSFNTNVLLPLSPIQGNWLLTPIQKADGFNGSINFSTDWYDQPGPGQFIPSVQCAYIGLFTYPLPRFALTPFIPGTLCSIPWAVIPQSMEQMLRALIVGPIIVPAAAGFVGGYGAGQLQTTVSMYVNWLQTVDVGVPDIGYLIGTYMVVAPSQVGVAAPSSPTWMWNYANYDFVRTSQLLVGAAARGT